jgi:hypothetical protein
MTSRIVVFAGLALASWSAFPPAAGAGELVRLSPIGSVETAGPTAPVQQLPASSTEVHRLLPSVTSAEAGGQTLAGLVPAAAG